jgi:hypothetical protein
MNELSESPFVRLITLGTPYIDYIDEIKKTYNFKYYSKFIYEAKSINWNLDNLSITNNQIRIIHAALLELFIEDNTPELFYEMYKDYLKEVFNVNRDTAYMDGDMNTIFHYDAVQGFGRFEAYTKIQNLHNEDLKKELCIDTDIFNISILASVNRHNVSVQDIIYANS